jgi:hypothetical protein
MRRRAERIGCGGRTRTYDHRINNPALYQLSYTTILIGRADMVACRPAPCKSRAAERMDHGRTLDGAIRHRRLTANDEPPQSLERNCEPLQNGDDRGDEDRASAGTIVMDRPIAQTLLTPGCKSSYVPLKPAGSAVDAVLEIFEHPNTPDESCPLSKDSLRPGSLSDAPPSQPCPRECRSCRTRSAGADQTV